MSMYHTKCGSPITIHRALTNNEHNYFYWFCCYHCNPEEYVPLGDTFELDDVLQ